MLLPSPHTGGDADESLQSRAQTCADRADAVLQYLAEHEHEYATSARTVEQPYCMRARVAALNGKPAAALKEAERCQQASASAVRLRTYMPALIAFSIDGALRGDGASVLYADSDER